VHSRFGRATPKQSSLFLLGEAYNTGVKYTVKDAQKYFEKLLKSACAGEEVLTQDGNVVVKLESIARPIPKKRVPDDLREKAFCPTIFSPYLPKLN